MSQKTQNISPRCELIFGGSFDPVHNGHLRIIEHLRKISRLNSTPWPIRLLPCSMPALKSVTNASFEQRVEMLDLLVKDFDDVFIDPRENQRVGKSYTIDSLESLALENSGIIRILVVGSDTLAGLESWHRYHELAKFCHLLVVDRSEAPLSNMGNNNSKIGFSSVNRLQQLEQTSAGLLYHLPMEKIDVSSTQVRKNLSLSEEVDKLIPQSIQDYIEKNSIFKLEKQTK